VDNLSEIRNPECTLCPLHEFAKTICVMGKGSPTAKIMIVGEAPGLNEDEQGQPFVGKAGKLLDEGLWQANIDPRMTYITNLAKCRPPKNRPPTENEAFTCAHTYLSAEYKLLKPTHILLLGNSALHMLTSLTQGIMTHRGKLSSIDCVMTGAVNYATIHPSAALRSTQNKDVFFTDLRTFGGIVEKESVLDIIEA
jgi:uracil-DNA glycosylase family 4